MIRMSGRSVASRSSSFGTACGIGHVAAPHAIDVLQFSRPARAVRLDADESAMRLDVGVGPLFQPAQRIRPAGDVGEGGFHARTFPEPFVEPFSKSAQRQRVAQDQDVDALGRRCGFGATVAPAALAPAVAQTAIGARSASTRTRKRLVSGDVISVRDTQHGNRFPANRALASSIKERRFETAVVFGRRFQTAAP